MKRIFELIITVFTCITYACGAHADVLNDCMRAISSDPDFQTAMQTTIFPDPSMLTQEGATQNKAKILGAVAAEMLLHCPTQMGTLTRAANGKVWHPRDGNTYAFQFKMSDLFQYADIKTGIMVYNNKSLQPGDVIQLSDIPSLYWNSDCSDHHIWENLSDDAAVNVAGQRTFGQYGGGSNEFFLDFEEGNNRRAFPGLVLMDKTGSTTERIVSFSNLHTAVSAAETFAKNLNNSTCSNDGLAVYVVALDVQKTSNNNKDGWAITAGVVGGPAAVVGIAAGLNALGVTTVTSTLLSVSGATTAAGPYLWPVAAALAATAGAISLIPGEISDIQQVMVLDGPYLIN